MTVANVDDDLGQEIMYGAMAVDHDGKGMCSTGYDHGDAIHVGDFVPSRPGPRVLHVQRRRQAPGVPPARRAHLRDPSEARSRRRHRARRRGRRLRRQPGAEMWASSVGRPARGDSAQNVGANPASHNFLIWWDADETRELEDKHVDHQVRRGDTRC